MTDEDFENVCNGKLNP
jgi:3-hydroxyacyl-CoA dehydrogenase/3a,7a,12a-trihydroxy-5b-cholest-24-enoyl-CoA hydratase